MENRSKRSNADACLSDEERLEKRLATSQPVSHDGCAACSQPRRSSASGVRSAFYGQGIQNSGTVRVTGNVNIGVSNNSDKHARLLKDLRLTDPRVDKTRIEDTKGGLLKDSYKWVLEHKNFRQWQEDRKSRLLWIKGDPGKGKTMLLCGIIDELKQQPDNSLSYFFCQATEPDLNNATAVLRGLIYVLVNTQQSLISHVQEKYDNAGIKLFQDVNSWYAMSAILIDMLQDESLQNPPLFIVDALDECIAGLPQLLDLIINTTSLCRVKWIVSSRNWPSIEEQLEPTIQNVRLCLELNEGSVSNAIRIYIHHKVDELARRKRYDDETRNDLFQHLVSNANGTFLWVALVCQKLADPKVPKRHPLAQIKSFPPGLNTLYQRMMEEIRGSDVADLCKQILAVVSVVYRPITLKELKGLVKSLEDFDDDLDTLKGIIGFCGSFLTVREGVIYFVHQSAKDFLLDEACDEVLPFGRSYQHLSVFSRSLEILSRTLRRDIYNLQALGFLSDKISSPDPDPLAMVQYSCVYWVEHLSDSDSLGHDKALQHGSTIYAFLRQNYLYWLEALAVLRNMSEGVIAIQKLEALVRNIEMPPLADLVRDAHRFVLFNKPAIEIAPLQVYVSALVFSPARSLVKRLFENEAPRWVMLKPAIEAGWNACMQTLEGHREEVLSVAFSVDGQQVASGSQDTTIKIWDATAGSCLQTLEGHGGLVSSVAFSADGQWVISNSRNAIKIWDAAAGGCLRTLEGHNGKKPSVASSADGRQVISSRHGGTIKIWDIATGSCLQTLGDHGEWESPIAFSADGRWVASGSYDKTITIWDVATGSCLRTLEGHYETVSSVAFSADGQRVASGSMDNTIKIWDAAIGSCAQTHEGHDGTVRSVAFSSDGRWVASGSDDATIKIWDAATVSCLRTLEGHGLDVMSVAFSADDQWVASGSRDKTIKIWDVATGYYLRTLEGHDGEVWSVAFSSDGRWVASGSDDATIKFWNANTGSCLQTFGGHRWWVHSVAVSADGQRVVSGSYDKTVKIWDIATGSCLRTLAGHGGWVKSVAFSADGQLVASCSEDKTIKIWDAATGSCAQTIEHNGTATCLSFHPIINSWLFTGGGVLNLDLPPSVNKPTTELSKPNSSYSGYGISTDGMWIVNDGANVLRLPWGYRPVGSAVRGSMVVLGCPSGRVSVMQFSSDGLGYIGTHRND
ncbi:hypothetical protein FALCPG4_015956 [Fusarium falciforme]